MFEAPNNNLRYRSTQWSESKFAKMLYQLVKVRPLELNSTVGEVSQWHKQAKSKNQAVYWFNEVALNHIQDFMMFFVDCAVDGSTWVNRALIRRTHVANTNLKVGEEHSRSSLMMSAAFQQLVDYVECDLVKFDITNNDTNDISTLRKLCTEKFGWDVRNPVVGVNVLVESIEDDTDDSGESLIGQKLLNLYFWWTQTRPAREHPSYECFSEIIQQRIRTREQDWEREDTEKLTELIELREYLNV